MNGNIIIGVKALVNNISLTVTSDVPENTSRFFSIKPLTTSEIIFYFGVVVICIASIAYLVWWTTKKRKNFFKDPDIKLETMKLHVRTNDERKKDEKYEKEVEKFLEKKRYIKGRK